MIRAKRNPKKKKWSWEDLSRALHSSTAQCVYIFLAGTARPRVQHAVFNYEMQTI